MENINDVKPLNTKILFQFLEDVSNSQFHDNTSAGGIVVVEHKENQVNKHRWGKVISTGPEVNDGDVSPGEYVFIEALGWTNGMDINVGEESNTYWFTDLEKILCVSDTKPDMY